MKGFGAKQGAWTVTQLQSLVTQVGIYVNLPEGCMMRAARIGQQFNSQKFSLMCMQNVKQKNHGTRNSWRHSRRKSRECTYQARYTVGAKSLSQR